MAWDDLPPDTSAAWTAAPPTKEELNSYGQDVVHNAGKELKAMVPTPEGVEDNAKTALALTDTLTGGIPTMDDVKQLGNFAGRVPGMAKSFATDLADTVTSPKEHFREKPIGTLLNAAAVAAPFMRGESAGEAAANVSRETMPEAAAAAAEAPKGLPVMDPGAKTGDPHALFSYNDDFGPGGAPRSMYTLFGDPNHPIFKQTAPSGAGGHGSTISKADVDALGIPVVGREPRTVGKFEPIEEAPKLEAMGSGKGGEPASRIPPDPNAPPPPKPPPPPADPLKDVKDYINSKYEKASGQPGFATKFAKYLQEEARKMGGKDIGLQLGQVKNMGPGFLGNEKAEALIDYARDKGYLEPGLSDVARKAKIQQVTKETGQAVGAIRAVADKRGAPPIDTMREQLKSGLEKEFGIDAPGEIEKVMAKFEKRAKENPTFSGMADLATELNRAKTPAAKMAQHPGPTTEGANIIGRVNNDAIRAKLNPQESEMYTQSLRDFGAHKKLEQAVASAGRKGLVGRGAPGSITNRFYQEALDRGGYRIGGNVADRVARAILKNPEKFKSIPDFFEEFAHHADDVIDDAVQEPHGMYQGGPVPGDVRKYVGC